MTSQKKKRGSSSSKAAGCFSSNDGGAVESEDTKTDRRPRDILRALVPTLFRISGPRRSVEETNGEPCRSTESVFQNNSVVFAQPSPGRSNECYSQPKTKRTHERRPWCGIYVGRESRRRIRNSIERAIAWKKRSEDHPRRRRSAGDVRTRSRI